MADPRIIEAWPSGPIRSEEPFRPRFFRPGLGKHLVMDEYWPIWRPSRQRHAAIPNGTDHTWREFSTEDQADGHSGTKEEPMQHNPKGFFRLGLPALLAATGLLAACSPLPLDPPTQGSTAQGPTEQRPTAPGPTEQGLPEQGPTEQSSAPSSSGLTQRGIGNLEVATTSIFDVEKALDIEFFYSMQTEKCSLAIAEDRGLAVVRTPEGMTMAFITDDPRLRTAENIGVGSSFDDVVTAYGGLVTELDRPSQTGGPIVVVDDLSNPGAELTDESRLFAFDTDTTGTVSRVRAGMWPWVGYIDYCSNDAHRTKETGWPLT